MNKSKINIAIAPLDNEASRNLFQVIANQSARRVWPLNFDELQRIISEDFRAPVYIFFSFAAEWKGPAWPISHPESDVRLQIGARYSSRSPKL